MDREKMFLDVGRIKRERAAEGRRKLHAFSIFAVLAAVLLFTVAAMTIFPGLMPKTTASTATLIKQADMTQTRVLDTIDKLDHHFTIVQISTQLRNLFTIEPTRQVVAQKPAEPVKSEVSKTQNPTPKPANTSNTNKPASTTTKQATPKTSMASKPVTQSKPTQSASKPVQKKDQPVAKSPVPTKKNEKKTIISQLDESIPIAALPTRPADANYGIPENWPLSSPVSAPYGYLPERGRFHAGVDLEAPLGTPIEAAGAGKVIRAEWYAGYGMCVDIEHANGYITRYGHFCEIYVKKGQWVSAGDWIGACGSTGNSSCPHLHFEIYKNGSSTDPEKINWTMRKMPPKAY